MDNKNHLYFNYLNASSEYYIRTRRMVNSKVYKVPNLPDCCVTSNEENSPWVFYTFKGKKIKDQGWKIHVSATLDNAHEILEDVSKVLIDRQIAFKHIMDESSLLTINSKNGNRTNSGKFITIYPPTDEVFLELLDILYEQVKDKENGPYILSDKCWKDSNIFYRYGGFRTISNEKGEPCIKDPDGNLIPDYRTPYYQVPKFVEEFDRFLDSKNILDEGNEEDRKQLKKYNFQRVLRYTNGGGIYLAERVDDKKKVVIKEARPKVGLDGKKRDAVERLNVEYKALTQLAEIKGVVNIIDYFKSWKHLFLVEEYIEGLDLKQWISVRYPFHRKNDKETYIAHVKKIILSLIDIILAMHSKNIGMGDLQPSNIMIDQEGNVTLIDFESAAPLDDDTQAAMQTIGFASHKNKNHKERDWYAIKKILRYCILPIGPVSSIDESMTSYQNRWIEREFGKEFYTFFRDIERICDKHLSETKDKEFAVVHNPHKKPTEEISSILEGLRKGIMKNLIPEEGLIHGDIRQYETPGGKYNVLTGGTGAALALSRSGYVDKKVYTWIEHYLINESHSVSQQGLFTGKVGIASTLYELGYKEEALSLFNRYFENLDLNDVSLRSGLAGIGLAYISLYLEENDSNYLKKAESIATHIKKFIENYKSLNVYDWAAVPIGLLDGWSGIALFYTAIYSVTKKLEFYYLAKDLIGKDLQNTRLDESIQILQTIDDRNRLLPYLSGGAIGIGVAIWYLNHVVGENLHQEKLRSIVNLNGIRCTFSGGLFDGIGGFLLLPLIMGDKIENMEKNIMESIDKLNLFLIRREDEIRFPGNFCYRLSDDLYTGSSGIILALCAILKSNPLYWLPIINIDSFIIKTKNILSEHIIRA